ncbi:putative receptor-like protein kinase At3g47110 [Argentina anserina]|uniref:putative receptor-like protein kinase At3g47110 n=1 Tax=Argentina anserina TaxID=57926 RepID=UPI0021764173|nr:putative receptor-like protein kinase At3g47110 [Potentilla anserina]
MTNFPCLHVLTLLLCINLLQPATFESSFGNETDHLALLKIKESIVSDPRGFLNSWNNSLHFCKWKGITCGRRHQRVTVLNLQNAELHGTISPCIGNLSFLRNFGLGNNSFSGKIPEQVVHLFRLRSLNLTFNMLEGEIPVNLTFCQELNVISIAQNRLTGKIPSEIGSLMKLVHFNIDWNNLSGGIPTSLGNLSSLIQLSLGGNNLEGTVPEEIGRLRNLRVLELNSGYLSGMVPPSIYNLSSIIIISIVENKFKGSFPPGIGLSMPNLQGLYLGGNGFLGQIPASLSNASKLQHLDVWENDFVGQVPSSFGNLPNIQWLNFAWNNLGNHFQGIIPSSLASLRGLQHLDLSGNNLFSQIPKDLQRLPFLMYLNLSFNNLEGEVPEGVFQNTSAISLDGNTKLCGGVPELQLPACPINALKKRKLSGIKLKLTISLVTGCSLLFAILVVFYQMRKNQKKKLLSKVSSIGFLSKVSYQTLHQATGGFSQSNQIGLGGFGTVYKGILDQTENSVAAIKVFNLQQKGASKSFMAECNALRYIRHKNLVKIITCCSSIDNNGNDFKALIYEYMSNGSLDEWLHGDTGSRSLSLVQRLNILVDVASALCYLHDHCEPEIIHRDLKPSNVLLDDDMVACVSDFGLARLISPTPDSQNQSSTIGVKGTIGYVAPEYAVGVEPSKQGDVYSYGILVLELFTRRRPTDEMFVDNCNIHTFVKMAIPGRLIQIVDPTWLQHEIEADEEDTDIVNLNTMNRYLWKCILPILKIGLACSGESPRNRMTMEEVLRELHHIKKCSLHMGRIVNTMSRNTGDVRRQEISIEVRSTIDFPRVRD